MGQLRTQEEAPTPRRVARGDILHRENLQQTNESNQSAAMRLLRRTMYARD